MGFFSGIKKVTKPFVDVPRWIGYEQLKGMTGWLFKLLKRTFVVEQTEHTETFEESMVRLKLTEADLVQRIIEFKRLLIFWICMFMLVFLYAAYLAGVESWLGFMVSIGVCLLTLSQAFRYHFWLFQIRQRKLGCTVREWWHSLTKTGKSQ